MPDRMRSLVQRRITSSDCVLAAAMIALLSSSPAHSESAAIAPERDIPVDGRFAGKKADKVAMDMSGIACMPPAADGARRCLVINDENRAAQFATLQADGTLKAGSPVDLIGKEAPKKVLGTEPASICEEQGEFGEFDGEGVAYDGNSFYVVGSHGCSRKKDEFRLSSFLLARIKADGSQVDLTYRLSDALRAAEPANAHFGEALTTANGLNIEGIVVRDGTLVAGLRGPSKTGTAYLVKAQVEDLFAPGSKPLDTKDLQKTGAAISIQLERGEGIRDLAVLPGGRLLALVGPAQEQCISHRVVTISADGETVKPLATLKPLTDENGNAAKAEGILVLQDDGTALRALVLFDGLTNGGPREYRLPSARN